MKILVFNWRDLKHTWAGGGEIYVFEQASRWVKMGHEVTVFCGQDIEKNLPSEESIDGIKIYRKGGRFSLYIWAAIYYFTRFRGKVDAVIDVENGIPFFTPLFCRVPKICYVYHVHGKQFFYEMYPPFNYIGYAVERFIFPFLYRNIPIIAISETTKTQLVKIGFKKNNITVVYCGISGSQNNIKKPVSKFSHPTILYLGRIKKYKRVDLLIKILPTIIKHVPQVRLIIAGWGTEAAHLTDKIMKSPLKRKISLMGPVSNEEKRTLLSKSWLFINPSIGEGWSIAVIEANFYGTPAAAFNVAGVSESIKNDETGLLAQNNEDLINNICNVLNDKILRERLSKNAKKWAQTFNWDRSARETLQMLEKVRRKK